MNNISLIFIFFILFSIYHNSSTLKNEKCECDIFQLSKNFSEQNRYELTNFTKQSGEINGHPFYFLIKKKEEKEIVWWNDTASSWMLQNYARDFATTISEVKNDIDCPNFSNTEDWTILANGSNEIKSKCLADINKCGEFNTIFCECLSVSNIHGKRAVWSVNDGLSGNLQETSGNHHGDS